MKYTIASFCIGASMVLALATPALADGSPIPWPPVQPPVQKKPGGGVTMQKLVADGSPIPWPPVQKKPGGGFAA